MNFSKLLFLLLFVACFSIACVTETKKVEKSANYSGNKKPVLPIEKKTSETSEGTKETPNPTSSTGQQIVLKGKNAEIKIEADLKTSLENQKHPNLWFEYKDVKENIVKKEFPDEIKEIIKNKWNTHLTYLYHKNITDNKNAIYESAFANSMEAVNSADKLEKLKIELPEKRKILTRDEIDALLTLQAKLATERFIEISKRFNQ